MNNILIPAAVALVLTAACVPSALQNTQEMEAKLKRLADADLTEAKLEPYAKIGNSTILGQAFLKTRGGDVKLAAGNPVVLFPASEYISFVFSTMAAIATTGTKYPITRADMLALSKKITEGVDARILRFKRVATVDAAGNFEFSGLPAGEYMLFCAIYWETGMGETGGLTHATVRIGDNDARKVILNETF